MIREAKKADGAQVVELLMVILRDMELPFLKKFGEAFVTELLLSSYETPTERYGYPRGIVAEIDGKIVGAAFGYPAKEEDAIDERTTAYLAERGIFDDVLFTDSEVFPDEWYLDSLVVDDAFRGRGIGSQLLTAIDRVAKRDGETRVGLNVDKDNPLAKQLYLRQGFEKVGEMAISGHWYDHLQRKINT